MLRSSLACWSDGQFDGLCGWGASRKGGQGWYVRGGAWAGGGRGGRADWGVRGGLRVATGSYSGSGWLCMVGRGMGGTVRVACDVPVELTSGGRGGPADVHDSRGKRRAGG